MPEQSLLGGLSICEVHMHAMTNKNYYILL